MSLDITFCAAADRCDTRECPQIATSQVLSRAQAIGRPLSWCDFSVDCPAYASIVDPREVPRD